MPKPSANDSFLSNASSNASSTSQVGFANLPNQIYRKAVKRGFDFTVLVVGASGIGKSTLINSLFLSNIYDAKNHPAKESLLKMSEQTLKISEHTVLLKEGSVELRLHLVDTPGFGDLVNNSNCWEPIIDFIDSKF